MTEPTDPLAITADLLTTAEEKENGQAITARNDVMRAQVYALLSIAQSLATIAANSNPGTEPGTDAPLPS